MMGIVMLHVSLQTSPSEVPTYFNALGLLPNKERTFSVLNQKIDRRSS